MKAKHEIKDQKYVISSEFYFVEPRDIRPLGNMRFVSPDFVTAAEPHGPYDAETVWPEDLCRTIYWDFQAGVLREGRLIHMDAESPSLTDRERTVFLEKQAFSRIAERSNSMSTSISSKSIADTGQLYH